MKILQHHSQLNLLGINRPNRLYWQMNTPQLYEEAVQRHEGYVAHLGPLVVRTGDQSTLAHSDRFIVAEPATQGNISWGEINRAFQPERFDKLLLRMGAYFNGLDVFVQDAYVRTSSQGDLMPLRVITETAWHNLFVRNTYLHPEPEELDDFVPEFTVMHAPGFRAHPERDGTNSDVFVIIHLSRKLILIGGTSFAGEIQKAIFSVINYLLPRQDILTIEASSNVNDKGESALFVGVDGSGKTCLATDNTRLFLGDTEHGWDHNGIFSISRGCYAHVLGLSMDEATDVWQTTRRFGTLMENVVVDVETRRLDLDDDSFTENTRASYPISHLLRSSRTGVADHPRHIFLLAKDGDGVLPIISKLTPDQAFYFFLSGYTTEITSDYYGKPIARRRFSACYGAPFMPLHPGHYAQMFAERIRLYKPEVWLLNTGWMGGAYGKGGRVPVEVSRAAVRAVLGSKLGNVDYTTESTFGLQMPSFCPGVPEDMLNPVDKWPTRISYDKAAQALKDAFDEHLAQYQDEVNSELLTAQPRFS
jgi:phosphoenolpyruvate carboxykinase (ATP)